MTDIQEIASGISTITGLSLYRHTHSVSDAEIYIWAHPYGAYRQYDSSLCMVTFPDDQTKED